MMNHAWKTQQDVMWAKQGKTPSSNRIPTDSPANKEKRSFFRCGWLCKQSVFEWWTMSGSVEWVLLWLHWNWIWRNFLPNRFVFARNHFLGPPKSLKSQQGFFLSVLRGPLLPISCFLLILWYSQSLSYPSIPCRHWWLQKWSMFEWRNLRGPNQWVLLRL